MYLRGELHRSFASLQDDSLFFMKNALPDRFSKRTILLSSFSHSATLSLSIIKHHQVWRVEKRALREFINHRIIPGPRRVADGVFRLHSLSFLSAAARKSLAGSS
jgi:hypothetical protein